MRFDTCVTVRSVRRFSVFGKQIQAQSYKRALVLHRQKLL
jgi:hypothetical protein